jgi:cytochrome c
MGNYAGLKRSASSPYLILFAAALLALGWIMLNFAHLGTAAAAPPSDTGDASRGESLFTKRCGGCHALDVDKEGPRLRGVFGRKAGSVPSFKYSEALKKSGVTWDEQNLDRWLTDPDKFIADNDMDFHLAKGDERSDVIAYLKTLSAKP